MFLRIMRKLFMKMSQKKVIICVLSVFSFIVHFAFFGSPQEVVFDEVYFGRFISAYENGEYYFDIHPPLGKLIIFGFVHIFDTRLDSDFSTIGNAYVDHEQFILRFLPCLTGSLIPIVLFFLALEMGFSLRGSTVLSILLIFENSLVVQTHFLFLDGFLILFGFVALLMYMIYRRCTKNIFLLAACVCGSLAVSIKWTGITFLFLILIYEIITRRIYNVRYVGKSLLLFVVVPCVLYFSFFIMHFMLLPHPGSGDSFMSKSFYDTQHDLHADLSIEPMSMWKQFLELNRTMYSANKSITQGHAYGSMWYTWPFMVKPVYYWTDDMGRFIYFFGNFVLWFFGAASVIWAVITQLLYRFRRNIHINLLLVGFFVNWFPFLLIDRVMFLYHYMISLIFSIMIGVYLLDKRNILQKFDVIFVSVVILAFLAFYPITYGVAFF